MTRCATVGLWISVVAAGCSRDTGNDVETDTDTGTVVAPSTPPVSAMNPTLLTGGWIRGLWGTRSDNVFAVGNGGLAAHWDGTRWMPFDLPAEAADRDLYDVFGFSSGNVFAVGARGTVLHYDGVAWSLQAIDGGSSRALYGVWGASDTDVYASGDGVIAHYDGSAWTGVDDPDIGGIEWRGISGSGPGEVLVAGEGGNFQTAHFLHFDGGDWIPVTPPALGGNTYLVDVFSVGPGAAFVVGTPGRTLFWNGSSLAEPSNPTNEALNGVWGVSADEAFAVGVRNTVLRYTSGQWRDLPFDIGLDFVPSDDHVASVFGFAGNDWLAAGRGVHHFDGATWDTILPSARPTSAWSSGEDDVLILGEHPLRVDGAVSVLEDFGGLEVPILTAAWGPPDHIVAVGVDGSAYRYDGANWGVMTTNHTGLLTDVWGSAVDDVFAVGSGGTILHFNGSAWGGMASSTDAYLSSVWGSGPDDVYAVGADGTIVHYNGTSWSPMASGVSAYLTDILGFDASTVLVAFDGGLLEGDGVSWVAREVRVEGEVTGVYRLDGTAPDELFLTVTTQGAVGHYDGEIFTPLPGLRGASFVEAMGPRSVVAGVSGGSLDERVVRWDVTP